MRIQRKELIDAIKFLLPAIGTNESRKSLMNLHVSKKKDKCILIAADAYKIKKVILDIMHEQKREKDFLIPRNLVILFRQMCNQAKHHDHVSISRSELSVDTHGIKYKQPEVDYPNLEKLINADYSKDKPGSNFIGISPIMMKDTLSDFPKNIYGSYPVVKMGYVSEDSPIIFETQDGAYTSVLMPVRIQW